MADDWIKMRTDIYRDPKVCVMAEVLMDQGSELSRHVNQHCGRDMTVTRNVMRNVTVGALVTVWGVTRHRGERKDNDLLLRNVTINVIDDIAELPGFGDAMLRVGWVIESDEGLVFPSFFREFNTDPKDEAKRKNAERQRKYREKSNVTRNVTVTSQSNVREEKRREENIIEDTIVSSCSETKNSSSEPPVMVFPVTGKNREWILTQRHIDEWQAAYSTLSIIVECRKAAEWIKANPTRRKTSKGMPSFLVNWFNRAVDRNGSSNHKPVGSQTIPDAFTFTEEELYG